MTATKITEQLLGYPKKEVYYSITDASILAAGVAITPATFGLDTIDTFSADPVEIAGSVNTQTLLVKYDPVAGKFFYFGQADDTSTTVAKPLAIIPGNIAAVPVFKVRVMGNDVNN